MYGCTPRLLPSIPMGPSLVRVWDVPPFSWIWHVHFSSIFTAKLCAIFLAFLAYRSATVLSEDPWKPLYTPSPYLHFNLHLFSSLLFFSRWFLIPIILHQPLLVITSFYHLLPFLLIPSKILLHPYTSSLIPKHFPHKPTILLFRLYHHVLT